MSKYFKKSLFLLWVLTSVLWTGCVRPTIIAEETPWHMQPSGMYNTAHGQEFYGVGIAEGLRNTTLLRATAANRARQEMARVLDNYVVELLHAVQTQPILTMEEGEQLIGSLVRKTLKRAVISEYQSDPSQAKIYALCRIDLETFKQVLRLEKGISRDLREAMWAEAENVYMGQAN